MSRRKIILGVAAGGLVLLFAAGLGELVAMRFGAGDIYPPYSSLRGDPLGTKVLYEALSDLPGVSAQRNYGPTRRLSLDGGTALLELGCQEGLGAEALTTRPASGPAGGPTSRSFRPDRSEQVLEEEFLLDRLAADGGRLVLTANSQVQSNPWQPEWARAAMFGVLPHRLGFGLDAVDALPPAGSKARLVQYESTGIAMEKEIPCRTRLFLKDLSSEWHKVYELDGRTVVAERPFGAGSVVVCCDSYFLSNEAMAKERCSGLLSWLIGRNRVIFDERHLGVVEETGIATLARRYRLTGVAAALVVLAGLFIWKNAMSFMPRRPMAEELSRGAVAGQASSTTLVSLLRRALPPADLLATCLKEWRAVHVAQPPSAVRTGSAELDNRAEAIIQDQLAKPKRRQDIAGAYRDICQAMAEKRPKKGAGK